MKHFLWVVLNKVQLWFSILSVADSFLPKSGDSGRVDSQQQFLKINLPFYKKRKFLLRVSFAIEMSVKCSTDIDRYVLF